MSRNLKVERLYNLGNYINIKIISEWLDVPEEIADDTEKRKLAFRSLAADCDQGYQEYKDLNVQINEEVKEGKDIRELLQAERDRIAEELEGEK
jgi:hypothetical protein